MFQQRFEHFQKAFMNLQSVKDENRAFSSLEKEGIVQRFEILIELSWKVIKDFVEIEGFMPKSPKEAILKGFECGILDSAKPWLEALAMRNTTSHTYTESELDECVLYILGEFLPLVETLDKTLRQKI